MKILLHICCGPCTIFPLKVLRSEGFAVQGLFFNPNIHPYQEYVRRLDTLRAYADERSLEVRFDEEYPLEEFLSNVALRVDQRCRHCYEVRMRTTANLARKEGFRFFTTTLLYGIYQKHDLVAEIGRAVAKETGVEFYYSDFRTGWKEGVDLSKELGMYRQRYCGCIYSEKERFFGRKRR
ncbi:MAG: epoxyqueuosine reductase QueH [Syntrophales bacterium]|nr:epoxyqueuosine reductase QueH [Syntrophales bacterium]